MQQVQNTPILLPATNEVAGGMRRMIQFTRAVVLVREDNIHYLLLFL